MFTWDIWVKNQLFVKSMVFLLRLGWRLYACNTLFWIINLKSIKNSSEILYLRYWKSFESVNTKLLPNQKFSWEDSVIMMGKPAMSHQIFVGQPHSLSGPMAGICRVYWGKLPTMRTTIYSCLWWDNPTSSPNNVGTSHALPRSFPWIYPLTQDIIMEFLLKIHYYF